MPKENLLNVAEKHTVVEGQEAERAIQYEKLMANLQEVVSPLQVELDSLELSVLDNDPVALEAWKQTDMEIRRIIDLLSDLGPNHELRQKYAAQEGPVRQLIESYNQKRRAYDMARQKKQEELAKTKQDIAPPASVRTPDIGAPPPPPVASKEELSMDIDEEIENRPGRPEDVEIDLETYQQKLRAIWEEVQMIGMLLKEKGAREMRVKRYNPDGTIREEVEVDVTKEMLEALMGFQMLLPELKRKAGSPKLELATKVEEGMFEIVDEAMQQLADFPTTQAKPPRAGVASMTGMPRIPSAPYRVRMANGPRRKLATLAVAPAVPPVEPVAPAEPATFELPENYDALDDAGQVKALEALQSAFEKERDRIVGEHKAVIRTLTEEIKERKLQALRDSLNT